MIESPEDSEKPLEFFAVSAFITRDGPRRRCHVVVHTRGGAEALSRAWNRAQMENVRIHHFKEVDE